MLTPYNVKDAVLQACHVLVGHIEISAGIPVFTCLRIVVEDLAVGIVEGTFESFAGTVFRIVLEDRVCHRLLLVAMYVLYDLLNNPSTKKVFTLFDWNLAARVVTH
jgi:hypothetical protein